jgi:glycosyltransferase involved in cell wall biosynthesis
VTSGSDKKVSANGAGAPPTPAISVVVPLYNKAAYIERTLESIRRQTWTDFEVIVVDDGSTDGSGTIAANFGDARFRVVTQKNAGPGAARNRGIAEARGDLIAFLDADDSWETEFLAGIMGLAGSYPDAGIVATGYRRCRGSEPDIEVTVRTASGCQTRLISNYFQAVREGDPVTSSSVAVRRSTLERTGGFVEGEPVGEDRDLWARISLHYPLAYDARILAIYHSEAQGRGCETLGRVSRYPPAVRSLRRLVREGGLSTLQTARARTYTDWLVLKHAYEIAYSKNRNALLQLLQAEEFGTLRYGFEALLLRVFASLAPLRLIAALKIKPANWLQAARRMSILSVLFGASDVLRGRIVTKRMIPRASQSLRETAIASKAQR